MAGTPEVLKRTQMRNCCPTNQYDETPLQLELDFQTLCLIIYTLFSVIHQGTLPEAKVTFENAPITPPGVLLEILQAALNEAGMWRFRL